MKEQNFPVDADLSFPVGTKVKINAGGIYDSFTRTLRVTSNASANIITMQTKFEEPQTNIQSIRKCK